MWRHLAPLVELTVLLAAAWQASGVQGEQRAEDETVHVLEALPAAVPAPADNPTTAAKVALGKKLFFDPRLSGDDAISCATCHLPDKGFGDGLATARGANGRSLARNSQGLWNVGFLKSLFWDGRAASLEEQALIPIESPDEMHQPLGKLEEELGQVPGYASEFAAVFGTPVDRRGIARALAAFQRTLVTGPSPFDRYLAGDEEALSSSARRGLELFRGEAGCIRCHHGPLLSDGKFYRLGVSARDKGRGMVTGNRDDDYRLRTPPLRNVAETGPYMHDGSLKTLDDVVMFYYRDAPGRGPEGVALDIEPLLDQSFSDMPHIVAFLRSLTGTTPQVDPPELPR